MNIEDFISQRDKALTQGVQRRVDTTNRIFGSDIFQSSPASENLQAYDADTVYDAGSGQGFRIADIDAPELATNTKLSKDLSKDKATNLRISKYEKLLKSTTDPKQIADLTNALNAAKEQVKSGMYATDVSAADVNPGQRARFEGEMTSVNVDGPNMYANTGATLMDFSGDRAVAEERVIGDIQTNSGEDKYGRKLISNPEYSKYMVEQGYAVPYSTDNEGIREGLDKAIDSSAGLWTTNRDEMYALYNKRNAPRDTDGYFGNLVDGVQYSLGKFGASAIDAGVDASNFLAKKGYAALTGKTAEEAQKDWEDVVRSSPTLKTLYDKDGNFVGMDKYKGASEYGYDAKRVEEWTKNFKDTMVSKDATILDKIGATVSGIFQAPEVFATSAGDMLAAASGIGTGAIIGNFMNETLAERAKIKGTNNLEMEDYLYAATGGVVYGLVNKFTRGNAGLKETTEAVKEVAKGLGKEGVKSVINKLGVVSKEVSKSGVKEGLEEIVQGIAEVVATKYDTKKQDEILSKDTALDLASQFVLGAGAGTVGSVAEQTKVAPTFRRVKDFAVDKAGKVFSKGEGDKLTPEQQAILDSGESADAVASVQAKVDDEVEVPEDVLKETLNKFAFDTEEDGMMDAWKERASRPLNDLEETLVDMQNMYSAMEDGAEKDEVADYIGTLGDIIKYKKDNREVSSSEVANERLYKQAKGNINSARGNAMEVDPVDVFDAYKASKVVRKKDSKFDPSQEVVDVIRTRLGSMEASKIGEGNKLTFEESKQAIDALAAESGIEASELAELAVAGGLLREDGLGSGPIDFKPIQGQVMSIGMPTFSAEEMAEIEKKMSAPDTTEADMDAVSDKIDDATAKVVESMVKPIQGIPIGIKMPTEEASVGTTSEKKEFKGKTKAGSKEAPIDRETSFDDDMVHGISGRTIRKYAEMFGLSQEKVAAALDLAVPKMAIANMKNVSKLANEIQYNLWYEDKNGVMPNFVRYKKALQDNDAETAEKAIKKIVKSGYDQDVILKHYEVTWGNIKELADAFRESAAKKGKTLTDDEIVNSINAFIADGDLTNKVSGGSKHEIDVREVVTGVAGRSTKVINGIRTNIEQIKSILDTTGIKFKEARGQVVSRASEGDAARQELVKLKEEASKLKAELEADPTDFDAKRELKVVNRSIANREEQLARLSEKDGTAIYGKKFVEEKYDSVVNVDDELGLEVDTISSRKANQLKKTGRDTSMVKVVKVEKKAKLAKDKVEVAKKLELLRNADKLRKEASSKTRVDLEKADVKLDKAKAKIKKLEDKFSKTGETARLGSLFRVWEATVGGILTKLVDLKARKKVAEKALKQAEREKQKLIDMINKANDNVVDGVLSMDSTAEEISAMVSKLSINLANVARLVKIVIGKMQVVYEVDALKKTIEVLDADIARETNTLISQGDKEAQIFRAKGSAYDSTNATDVKMMKILEQAEGTIKNIVRLNEYKVKIKVGNVDHLAKINKKIEEAKASLLSQGVINKARANSASKVSRPEKMNENVVTDVYSQIKIKPTLMNSVPMGMLEKLLDADTAKELGKVIIEAKASLGAILGGIDPKVLAYKVLDNPALGILLDKNGDVIPEIAAIVGVAVKEFTGTNAGSYLVNSDEDIARMRQVQESYMLSPLEKDTFRVGKLAKNEGAQLGQAVMQALGVSANKAETSKDFAEKLKTGFGHIGLMMMQHQGEIKDIHDPANGISSAVMDKINEDSKGNAEVVADASDVSYVAIVKSTVDFKGTKATAKREQLKKVSEVMSKIVDAFSIDGAKKSYRTTKRVIKGKFGVRDSVLKAPDRSEEVLKVMTNEEYVLDLESLAEFKKMTSTEEGIAKVKKMVGYKDLVEMESSFTKDKIEGQAGINMEVDRAVDELIDMLDKHDRGVVSNSFFFDWFMSKNGRYLLDSVTVNPQTEKNLHRWLITAKDNVREWDMKNTEDVMFFKEGVAQAYGFGIDKNDPKATEAFADKVLEADMKVLEETLETGMFEGKEVPHLGHMLQAFNAVKKYKGRVKDKFTAAMVVEYDEVTSGFALKLMQLPLLEFEKLQGWLFKTGIVVSRDDASGVLIVNGVELKYRDVDGELMSTPAIIAQAGFLDAYKTLATGVNDVVKSTEYNDKDHGLFNYITKNGKIIEAIVDDKGVTSFGRNLFKYPFMMFNYGASLAKLRSYIGYHIADKIIDRIANGDFAGKEFAEFRIKLAGSESNWDKMMKELVGKDAKYVKDIRLGGKPLEKMLIDTFASTYGEAFTTSMEEFFSPILEANTMMTNAAQGMFKLFDAGYKQKFVDKINELNDTDFVSYEKYVEHLNVMEKGNYPNKNKLKLPTIEEENALVESLSNMFPGLKAPNSKNREDGIGLVDSEVVSIKDSPLTKVSTPRGIEGGAASGTLGSMVRKYKETIAAGAVLPTHWEDGTSIGESLIQGGIMGIHDAIVVGVNHKKALDAVNDKIYTMSRDYSTTSEYLAALIETIKAAEDMGLDINDKEFNVGYDELKLADVLGQLSELDLEVTKRREELFSNTIIVGNMAGPVAGVESKAVAKTTNDIMSNKKLMDKIAKAVKKGCK